MRVTHVVVGTEMVPVVDDDGNPLLDDGGEPIKKVDELWHEFKGDQTSWMTEPSGVLHMFREPNKLWASYAPGEWKAVRVASGQD